MWSNYMQATRTSIVNYCLLTKSEIITGKSQTEALMYWPSDSEVNTLKAEVWDFPVMTERTRLISYLLYGLFSAILKKNTIKTLQATFHIRLRALGLSSSLIRKKYLYASFFFQLSIFSVVFAHAHVVLLTTPKSRRAKKKFHNALSLQGNNARSAANQSVRTIVAV